MKTPKNLNLTVMLILFYTCSYSQESYRNSEEPTVITLVSSKNIHDANELVIELEGEIFTKTWSKDSIVRIEMQIKASGVTREVVKYLITKRRFAIRTQTNDDGSVFLFTPNLKQEVYINGYRLFENISYLLLVPENMLVRIRPTRYEI